MVDRSPSFLQFRVFLLRPLFELGFWLLIRLVLRQPLRINAGIYPFFAPIFVIAHYYTSSIIICKKRKDYAKKDAVI